MNHHQDQEQEEQKQQRTSISYRVNITISDWSSSEMMNDAWSCLIVLVLFWFFVRMCKHRRLHRMGSGSCPNLTLSWNIIHGSGRIQQKNFKSSEYYVAVGNLNPEEVEVQCQYSSFSSTRYVIKYSPLLEMIQGRLDLTEVLAHKDDDLLNLGSSYDSVSHGVEDLEDSAYSWFN